MPVAEPKIIDLVFEGGGMKGVAFIGALRALTSYGYQPGRLLGASVGSLFAVLLAAGYSANELYDLIYDSKTGELRLTQYFKPYPPFETLQIDASATNRLLKAVDLPFIPNWFEGSVDIGLARILMKHPSLKDIFNYIEKGGVTDPRPFVEWLESLLEAKLSTRIETQASDLTLERFFEVTQSHLSLIAADVTNPTMLILNHVTTPNLPVVQAVRMATAAPFFFPPVVWERGWGMYGEQELTGEYIVDGGLLSNFPIELFLSQDPIVTKIMGDPEKEANVLGLLLDESRAVPGAPITDTHMQLMLNDLPGLALIGKMLRTVLEARDKRAIETASEHVVRLPTMGYAPFAFNLTPEQLQPLLNAGHNAMIDHLKTHDISRGNRPIDEYTKTQVDNRAMHIINVYGNLMNVVQNIRKNEGTVIGMQMGAVNEQEEAPSSDKSRKE
jgi:NTE family protein